MTRIISRVRREALGFAQAVWEIFHTFDTVRVSGLRVSVVDTGTAERIAAVRAGARKVGRDG